MPYKDKIKRKEAQKKHQRTWREKNRKRMRELRRKYGMVVIEHGLTRNAMDHLVKRFGSINLETMIIIREIEEHANGRTKCGKS